MTARTVGAIALRPTGNHQGGHFFFSLSTGRVLNRSHWTVLPMPTDVIDRVHKMSRRDETEVTLYFATKRGQIEDEMHDDVDDDTFDPANNDNTDEDDDDNADAAAPVHIVGVNDNSDVEDVEDGDEYDLEATEPGNELNENTAELNDEEEVDKEPNPPDNDEPRADNSDVDGEDKHDPEATEEEVDEEPSIEQRIQQMDAAYGQRQHQYDLRARKPRDYSHLHVILEGTVMTQHNIKKGLQVFGEAGVEAVLKELNQLHERGVLKPTKNLSHEQRMDALQYLMFLKQKRNGTIKGRGCADGRKQRQYTTKEEASSPTVAIESVMLSCVLDALEERDVATVDIPGAFMQADMDDLVHMKLEGKMAELLVRIDPKLYREHIQIERGKQVLYVELKKALYGTLKAALLFWRRLSSQLGKWGFELNPYDSCVMNKVIDGKQCTILWHVDDLKISHVDAAVVTKVIDLLETEFGVAAPLTKTRGKTHEYLGMTINFNEKGKVQFTMIDYIKEMMNDLPPDMDGTAPNPAGKHLFDVNDKTTKLDVKTAELYHHNTAKLLFLCKRARPDIQTAVAFLCTRVKNPDEDDYKKLTRTIRYLRGSINMPLILEANNTRVIKWWVDASFAVHPDMRSHTGGAMSMGKGIIYGTSTRQKLNTKSSTEGELVGVNDVMPQVLWTR